MRVLLTGAAGFIGSHVADLLADRGGHEVVGIDGMLPQAHGTGEPPDGVERLDLLDADGLDRVLRGVDAVCHQAAAVGAGVDAADAPLFAANNDLGTAELLAAMARAGCRRLVLASSMVVYGDGAYVDADGRPVTPLPRTVDDLRAGRFERLLPGGGTARWALTGEDAPIAPNGLYAASKAAQEFYAAAWARATGGSVTALRYHNVYGPRMPRDTPYAGVASIFRSALAAGRPPRVFEDGRQARDFVHVRDVAAANLRALDAPADRPFRAYNVCSGVPVTIGDVAAILASESPGAPAPVVTGEFRTPDVRHIVADPARAAAELGFTASIRPECGLAEFATAPLR
ncbi:NAD-dependent epimerase/dehydratase family protein [Tsukamurella paurometabola]|uniref:NAD-dependent epimerase/dehydratase family protein n=1 Tax=Tsukamurella paurometabola TaxID=2061 RepID=A0A3P8LET9_TSUPA|nr:NAD-dependent epimerase/dehydratase family protein [Tsukamurella paurometabola]MBS4102157.1 NAD-dependent epimerase/dehydratase family protein [Tsukamurella paurometabola]UEA82116.1 NAD-dependent epimerase/dehydratase family protein [Tsukamurella paurometabola]VDR39152.1 dTDP-glucose 4,6-dehydratase [Tsukamurella paurometabola]